VLTCRSASPVPSHPLTLLAVPSLAAPTLTVIRSNSHRKRSDSAGGAGQRHQPATVCPPSCPRGSSPLDAPVPLRQVVTNLPPDDPTNDSSPLKLVAKCRDASVPFGFSSIQAAIKATKGSSVLSKPGVGLFDVRSLFGSGGEAAAGATGGGGGGGFTMPSLSLPKLF